MRPSYPQAATGRVRSDRLLGYAPGGHRGGYMAENYAPAGGLPSEVTGIRVDPAAVDKFAGVLETEINGNFTPMAERLKADYQPGVNFGLMHRSPAVQAARTAHAESLHGACA